MNRSLFVWMVLVGAMTVNSVAEAGSEMPKPALDRPDGVRYELHGVIGEYVAAITREWLLKLPDTNPAILEMFADRDKQPPRQLLPWSGEFAGKYLTGVVLTLRLTHDPTLKQYIARFVSKLTSLQADDGYLGPFPADNRLEGKQGTWDVWGHYHIMLGLLLWHADTGDPQALRSAIRIGDLLCRKFLHTGKRIVDTGSAEMNHAAIHSLGLLYEVTRKRAYLDLARQILDEFQDNRAGDYLRARWPARNSISAASRGGKACTPSRASPSCIGSRATRTIARPSSVYGGASLSSTAITTADSLPANRPKGIPIIRAPSKPVAPSPGSP